MVEDNCHCINPEMLDDSPIMYFSIFFSSSRMRGTYKVESSSGTKHQYLNWNRRSSGITVQMEEEFDYRTRQAYVYGLHSAQYGW